MSGFRWTGPIGRGEGRWALPRSVMTPLMVAGLLAALVCQWLALAAVPEIGALGMGAPIPVSWDAGKPGASGNAGHGNHRLDVVVPAPPSPDRQARKLQSPLPEPIEVVRDSRDLLLRMGRLLLEGG